MKRVRILYQVFFFGLFVFLVAVMDLSYLKGYPVRWFLEMDPLVGLATSLAAHTLYQGLIWGLLLVVVTVVLGRVFCSWVCPLGALHDFSGAVLEARPATERIHTNRFRPLYNLKYYLLVALLVMAAGHSLQIGWLDPIPFLMRAMAVFVQPVSQGLGQGLGLDPVGSGGVAAGIVLLGAGIGWLVSRLALGRGKKQRWLRDAALVATLVAGLWLLYRFSSVEPRRFHWGFFVALTFVVALALNRLVPRFWCRALCPLGALLGLTAKFSLWRIHRDPVACTGCTKCVTVCPGACDPHTQLRQSECLVCLNCIEACPEGGIGFKFLPPLQGERRPSPDLSRRRLIGAASVGALWVLGVHVGSGNRRTAERDRIRPPGSLDEAAFLERCLKCGACMRVCPTNVIQPALAEAGVEGLWTPVLVFKVGACERECTLCGQVCPTGAIQAVSREQKLGVGAWKGHPIRLGTAFFDRGRCLAWAAGKPCVVCEEVCPVSPKAIYVKPAEVVGQDGVKRVIGLPYVEPERCVGCGMCEQACPVHDQRAVRVTSVGETRSPENRMLLGRSG